jgi:hypothetical protein
MNTVGMSATPASTTLVTSTAPGGNVYVGPSLSSSLFKVVAAIATARP